MNDKTYCAYVRFKDGSPDIAWRGLRKTQAQWRYHWLNRNVEKLYPRYCEFGWKAESFNR
jgi:hypothetical protein